MGEEARRRELKGRLEVTLEVVRERFVGGFLRLTTVHIHRLVAIQH